ncbi:MAG TPA: c-type cytochrome [Steroidobacteraceae bacterium]|nr:c-type cytochrome [Steroidobacteraceae bacterium]
MSMLPIILRALAILAGVAVLAIGTVYGISEWKMRRTHDAPLLPLRAQFEPDPVAGEHMARVVGCWAGCHGNEGEGGTDQIEGIHTNAAPTLSQVVPLYTDQELARLIRYGVKRDGRSAVGMYAGVLWPLGDQDLVNIIAHLRLQPSLPPVPRAHQMTFRGRVALVTGKWKVSAEQVDRSAPRWGELPRNNAFERGRYLAGIVCSECHGVDFNGSLLEGGPSLAIIAAYQPEQFHRLMRTGKPIDERDMPKMNWLPDVGFTDAEIGYLYHFLREYHGLAPAADSSSSNPG